MKALLDADILRYEVGFGAEQGWKAITGEPDALPPFEYVEEMLLARIEHILHETKATECELFFTTGRTFRFDIATTKPYKGQRVENKPWHFLNLTMYFRDVLKAREVEEIEADDAMAIEQVKSNGECIICSRDKDLRQVPGWFYSWELGNQPSFGPTKVTNPGELTYDKGKLSGTGYAFFAAQMIMGDSTDNIPGIPGKGPKAAYEALKDEVAEELIEDVVKDKYAQEFGSDYEEYMLEQGKLLWVCRRRVKGLGLIEEWEPGLYE